MLAPLDAANVPATHAVQLVAFVVLDALPAEHAVHARSLVEVPAVETYVPAAQLVHGAHDVAFVVVE